jgi:hypothetical protein
VFAVIRVFVWVATIVGIPTLLIWGWIRCGRDSGARTIPSILSLIGFSFVTSSALLALFAALYARFIKSFQYYDPTLMRIFGVGALLSLAGMGFAIGGVWHRRPIRWHALVVSIGMIVFRLLATNGE